MARFEAGTILASRYRIVGRLGQGGMGEVYRADDLTLGQPVAMKFLPESLEGDPARLAQLHNEVRLARQIAHKNVCRVYDVGDADGRPFLTMEYVDGEDLASLLRRIGRVPEDKGLELARQLCAGIAAAHERGVLHRDLKPANVMLDGAGDVRITDFGLAEVTGSTDQIRAGTPAYMAPEQLAGQPATTQSDLYALGLLLYEIFTGRRAFSGSTINELVRQQQQFDTAGTRPSAIVKDLDPAIERAILRTLERDPNGRPRSALAVAAILPGGDPLAAALAAGETPSPEMVAAAGARTAVKHTHAILGAVVTLAFVVLAAVLSPQRITLSHASVRKSPDVLVDRAHQVLTRLGWESKAIASHWEFTVDGDLVRYSLEQPDRAPQENLFIHRPGGLLFYFRTSPRSLVPLSPVRNISDVDPPFEISGMTALTLDPDGRLISFFAVPPQKDDRTPEPTVAPNWPALFELAGLDMTKFRPVPPEWLPRGEADSRAAWEGTAFDSQRSVRVEAAAWRGQSIYFQTIWPWTRPNRMETSSESAEVRYTNYAAEIVTMALLTGALFLARRNVRAGRSDTKGALRLGTVAVFAQLIAWALNDPHVGNPAQEINRFFESLGESLFAGGVLYVMHLAVEPAMRRHWPNSLLGWTRLLRGRDRRRTCGPRHAVRPWSGRADHAPDFRQRSAESHRRRPLSGRILREYALLRRLALCDWLPVLSARVSDRFQRDVVHSDDRGVDAAVQEAVDCRNCGDRSVHVPRRPRTVHRCPWSAVDKPPHRLYRRRRDHNARHSRRPAGDGSGLRRQLHPDGDTMDVRLDCVVLPTVGVRLGRVGRPHCVRGLCGAVDRSGGTAPT